MSHSRGVVRSVVVVGVALATLAGAGFADDPPAVTVIMSGLDNPRGIAIAPNGAVFVAEAGRGAAPCPPAGGTINCYGHTGAVSRYWHGRQDRVVTGLPSISFPQGNSARGAHDIAMLGLGTARVTIGMEADPRTREALHRTDLAWLVDVPASTLMAPSHNLRPDDWSLAVDIGAFEAAVDPHPGRVESDPYALLAEPGGYVLTDASGNSLLHVDEHGDVSALAVFPSRPERTTDSVPTTVAVGPDGAYYVGEFTGFGAPLPAPGSAKVYRVVPGEAPTVFCTGFSRIIGIAFDTDGSLWVLQHSTTPNPPLVGGLLFRVVPPSLDDPDRSCPDRTLIDTGVALDMPTAVALTPDAIYITNRGTKINVGEVLRIER